MSLGINTRITDTREQPSILSRGKSLYVGGAGEGNYTKIQDAIDNASDGDTVFVFDDSSPYYELLLIDKPISLIGEDKDSTVIDAGKHGTPVKITADDGCLVSGFTIQNCKSPSANYQYAVVKIVSSNYVTVKDNILSIGEIEYNSAVAAIYLYRSSNNIIQDNYVFEENMKARSTGIALRDGSSRNIISGNDISVYCHGIRTEWNVNCDYNTISNNYIHHNFWGISLVSGSYNKILDNTIKYNEDTGIDIDANHNTISGNIISYNGESGNWDCGIMLCSLIEENNYNIISDNVISYNKPTGVYIIYSYDNVITRNNFIDNYGEERPPERWWGNAYFDNDLLEMRFFNMNSWEKNYWSDSLGFLPKIIRGLLSFGTIIWLPWFEFDWRPASEPYDI